MTNTNNNTNNNETTTSTKKATFHAVGPGKQFPPAFRGKPEAILSVNSSSNNDNNNDHENMMKASFNNDLDKNNDSTSAAWSKPTVGISSSIVSLPVDTTPWKVYDAAESMVRERRQKVYSNNKSVKKSLQMKYTSWTAEFIVSQQEAIYRNILMKQEDDVSSKRLMMVHATFRIAAITIVDAIVLQQQKLLQTMNNNDTIEQWKFDLPLSLRQHVLPEGGNPPSSRNESIDGTVEAAVPNITTTTAPQSIADVRAYCMERSYENKEYTKRKGGKTEINKRPTKIMKVTTANKSNSLVETTKAIVASTSTKDDKELLISSTTNNAMDETTTETVVSGITPLRDKELSGVVTSTPITGDIDMTVVTTESNPETSIPDIVSSSSTTTRSRPTTTIYTTHAVMRAVGDYVFHQLYSNTIYNSSLQRDRGTIVNNEITNKAEKIGQQIVHSINYAVRKQNIRYRYRKQNAYYDDMEHNVESGVVSLDRPFSYTQQMQLDQNDNDQRSNGCIDNFCTVQEKIEYNPNPDSLTDEWERHCKSLFVSILESGSGHGLYMDMQWYNRHGRIADLLRTMIETNSTTSSVEDEYGDCRDYENYGPHLIITTENNVSNFAQEFHPYNNYRRFLPSSDDDDDTPKKKLFVLPYHGSKMQRQNLRKLFPRASGTPNAPFHVLVTSYDCVMDDFFHFCHVPFDTIILDNGAALLAHSSFGQLFNSSFLSNNDQNVGMIAPTIRDWDFTKDDFTAADLKDACIGLASRHRILTTPSFTVNKGAITQSVPFSNLFEFVLNHFYVEIKDECEKSKIWDDSVSYRHFGNLLSQVTVVYSGSSSDVDRKNLAREALAGGLQNSTVITDPVVPTVYSDEDFLSTGKDVLRPLLRWLGPPETSWLRYALGKANISYIVETMKLSIFFSGHFCDAIATSSSLTSAGAIGQVSGVAAFRLAVRCGRHFGSELGLRQHLVAQHGPSGTWNCRKCTIDCITSQARTHHEKTCGQELVVQPIEQTRSVDILPASLESTGQKSLNVKKKGGKAAQSNRSSTSDKPSAVSVDLGESAENVVPSLSVINIKDLPPDVKPLLRDPRQTSRTGGNSKRHIYAYRGVCRQARKGHDRWQSQISFAGVNHYLGTFDSEWDAAAIYAWAHLLLYGEEATKLAQKEGEEAAAAYEQEQRDIAAGKIPEPQPKPESKKKVIARKQKDTKAEDANETQESKASTESNGTKSDNKQKKMMKKKAVDSSSTSNSESITKEKKIARDNQAAAAAKKSLDEKEAMTRFLSKSVMKAPIFGPRVDYLQRSDTDLIALAGPKLKMARMAFYTSISPGSGKVSAVEECLRPCVPYSRSLGNAKGCKVTHHPVGSAMLVGLSPSTLKLDLRSFVNESFFTSASEQDVMATLQLLSVEYDEDGTNEKFQSFIQGTVCTIGCASQVTQEMYNALGLGAVPLGGSVGNIDCHVGGIYGSCSELAACIRYSPTESKSSMFQFSCMSPNDTVTLNGEIVSPSMGYVPIHHEDICSVGGRVFAFVVPS